VYSESDSDSEKEEIEEASEMEEPAEKKKTFPKSFIFSCVGIGLTNIARKTE
jgi:hypothetical protein